MKTSALLAIVLSVFVSACGDDPAPAPSTVNQPPRFSATLSPANEVPAVTNAEATASGTATITLNTTKDTAGNITAATADFSVTLSGLPAGTSITAAHIHTGAAGVAGGVLVNPGLTAGEVVVTNGSGSFTKMSVNVTVEQANNIIANPAGFYFNVHSALNGGGLMRGQLVRTN